VRITSNRAYIHSHAEALMCVNYALLSTPRDHDTIIIIIIIFTVGLRSCARLRLRSRDRSVAPRDHFVAS
jgi:hypothetical protein